MPSLQLHYVRGCSLAEAFYQSISGPYQLLIVGDPLCQPWAAIPKIAVEGVKPDEKVKGTISITPSGRRGARRRQLRNLRRRPTSRPQHARQTAHASIPRNLPTATTNCESSASLGRRSKHKVESSFRSRSTTTTPQSRSKSSPHARETSRQIKDQRPAAGATAITIRQNSRDLGRVKGEAGEVEIAATTLGRGPTTLQAFSEGNGRPFRRRFASSSNECVARDAECANVDPESPAPYFERLWPQRRPQIAADASVFQVFRDSK